MNGPCSDYRRPTPALRPRWSPAVSKEGLALETRTEFAVVPLSGRPADASYSFKNGLAMLRARRRRYHSVEGRITASCNHHPNLSGSMMQNLHPS